MDATTIKCRALMVGDWCCNQHGFPMQITNVGDDYAYATFEGNEGGPWEFDDMDDQPEPIPLTPEILEKNDFWIEEDDIRYHEDSEMWVHSDVEYLTIEKFEGRFQCYNIPSMQLNYVHQIQQVLRLAGMTEMANNFKI